VDINLQFPQGKLPSKAISFSTGMALSWKRKLNSFSFKDLLLYLSFSFLHCIKKKGNIKENKIHVIFSRLKSKTLFAKVKVFLNLPSDIMKKSKFVIACKAF
jgi:hypothetical protein